MVSAVEFVKRLLHELRHRMAPLTYYKFNLPVATWGLVHYSTKGTTMIAYVLILKKIKTSNHLDTIHNLWSLQQLYHNLAS